MFFHKKSCSITHRIGESESQKDYLMVRKVLYSEWVSELKSGCLGLQNGNLYSNYFYKDGYIWGNYDIYRSHRYAEIRMSMFRIDSTIYTADFYVILETEKVDINHIFRI